MTCDMCDTRHVEGGEPSLQISASYFLQIGSEGVLNMNKVFIELPRRYYIINLVFWGDSRVFFGLMGAVLP